MRIATFAIACALAATSAAFAQNCPPLQRVASVDLVLNKAGGALVPVSIGGQPLTFHLATSGAQSMISTAAAERLQLQRRSSPVQVVNERGGYANTVAVATDFRIGNLRYPSAELRELIEPPNPNAPQGILGADLLRNYDVDLDFGASRLNLISRDHCPGTVVYWPSKMLAKVPMRVTDDNRIVFRAVLDGHELEATIETSAPRTVLTGPVAKEVFGIDATSPGARPAEGERFRYRFGAITMAGLEVKNPDILVLPDPTSHMRRHGFSKLDVARNLHQAPPLRLGMATLRQLHVYIDYKNLTLYFTPAQPDAGGVTEPAGE